jgi:hypothetical protein
MKFAQSRPQLLWPPLQPGRNSNFCPSTINFIKLFPKRNGPPSRGFGATENRPKLATSLATSLLATCVSVHTSLGTRSKVNRHAIIKLIMSGCLLVLGLLIGPAFQRLALARHMVGGSIPDLPQVKVKLRPGGVLAVCPCLRCQAPSQRHSITVIHTAEFLKL